MGRRWWWGCVMGLILTQVAGCGTLRPKRYPVQGKLLLDGKPISYGEDFEGMNGLCFYPIGGGRVCYANADKEGNFVIGNYEEKDGIPLGEYEVEVHVAWSEPPVGRKALIPEKYTRRQSSGLRVEITQDTREIVIDLQSS